MFESELSDCICCPRNCHGKRTTDEFGYCRSGAGFGIGSIFAHRGEEPVISGPNGICNLFFTHCNMQCIFCQNYQISRNTESESTYRLGLAEVVHRVESILDDGVRAVGFVSPSHCIPQMKAIMHALEVRGRMPVYVFNTNAYDKKETIKLLEGKIDVYLPDLKYMDAHLAGRYSDTPDYPQIASQAIREMFRQKGSSISLGDDGSIESGLIIRHLVLPGQIENSKKCLRFIAEELSPSVHISLMSQYYPTSAVAGHPELGRRLTPQEYDEVLAEFHDLGFHRGWVQSIESPGCYQPDFTQRDVFEHP